MYLNFLSEKEAFADSQVQRKRPNEIVNGNLIFIVFATLVLRILCWLALRVAIIITLLTLTSTVVFKQEVPEEWIQVAIRWSIVPVWIYVSERARSFLKHGED